MGQYFVCYLLSVVVGCVVSQSCIMLGWPEALAMVFGLALAYVTIRVAFTFTEDL